MGCGMDRQLVYGMNRVLYGVGRVPLFWPDCLPSPGSCFFLLPKLVSLVLDIKTNLVFSSSVAYILGCYAHAPFCSLWFWRVLTRSDYLPWYVSHCSRQFGAMSSKMSSVIVSYQMNMFKLSEKFSSLLVWFIEYIYLVCQTYLWNPQPCFLAGKNLLFKAWWKLIKFWATRGWVDALCGTRRGSTDVCLAAPILVYYTSLSCCCWLYNILDCLDALY